MQGFLGYVGYERQVSFLHIDYRYVFSRNILAQLDAVYSTQQEKSAILQSSVQLINIQKVKPF